MPARRIVQVAGKDVRLLTGGDGPPLLYLHAVGADVDWLEIHDRLARHFTVHLPAHPGFAESTGIEQVDGIADVVLHYVDLLGVLGLRAVPVVGASFGGASSGSSWWTPSGSGSTPRRSGSSSGRRRRNSPRCSSTTRTIPSRRCCVP